MLKFAKVMMTIASILMVALFGILLYYSLSAHNILDKSPEVTYTTTMIGANYRTTVDYPNPANINIIEDDDSWTVTFEISK